MWNFQRIICMWICCVSCMFGTTQLSSSLVRAVPYEYFDEHEQSFYDLDSEQIQAKYDTRLLSEQMLQTERQQHFKELKGLHGSESERRAGNRKSNDDGGGSAAAKAKLRNNDGHTLGLVGPDLEDNDDDGERKGWLEESATEVAAPTQTTTIAESLDDLHLPRAASCFTNGQKFTHGQKVPRLDSCEVCLCMDGEIFCWWEKCDKKSTKAFKTYNDYTVPFEESATMLTQLNGKAARKTTLMPIRKPKTNEDYKYNDDDSAEIREMQQEFGSINKELMQTNGHAREQNQMHEIRQITKKSTHRQEKEQSATCNKKFNEQIKNKKKPEEQQQNRKQHKINEQHHHTPTYNNNRNTNDNSGSSGSNSKILNFPENLPSILYYDYKTEEHHQHQHQHREQHLKHQKQKQQQKLLLQQHEKEIKQQQKQHQSLVNRQHEYGQDFSIYSSHSLSQAAAGARTEGRAVAKVTTGSKSGDEEKLYGRFGNTSTTFKYSSNGNEHIYNEDLQTDSDILPEPPTNKPTTNKPTTNKPTFLTSLRETESKSKTIEDPKTQFYRLPNSVTMATSDGTLTKLTTATGSATNISPTASLLLKNAINNKSLPKIMKKIIKTNKEKQIFLPWGHNKPSRDKTSNSDNNGNGKTVSSENNENNDSAEDTIDAADQDDAFHRWLTSTEKNNKNNFTVSDAFIGKHGDDDDDDEDGDNDGGFVVRGLGAGNNDYNVDERNYGNTNWETAAAVPMLETKTSAAMGALAIKGEETTTITHAFNSAEEAENGGTAEIYYANIHKPKYEQNLSENGSYSNNSDEMTTSSGATAFNNQSSHNNTSQLNSDLYKNNYMESNEKVELAGVSTSTTSNEDNGVAGVVNIDIMLTASNADTQKQQQHHQQEDHPQQTNIETTKERKSQSQLQDFNNEKQIAKTQLKFIQPQILISNTNEIDSNNPLYSIINDNSRNPNTSSNNNNSNNTTNIAGNSLDIKHRMQLPSVGVNLSSSTSIFNNTSASSQGLTRSNDSFKLNHLTGAVPQTSATSAAATPHSRSTTLSPQRQCNVMGTLYKIGDVLPQDTGNCLQCICIDGSTSDDTPRVTCSPHNCPPLVLPDLFDATGY